MLDKMIVDADICIKLGSSEKYKFLYDILPLIAKQIYMHAHVQNEVLMPPSAVHQLKTLVNEQKVQIVHEEDLENHLTCIHIADVVRQAYIGEMQLTRKTCKAMWLAAGYRKEVFDQELWPLQNT